MEIKVERRADEKYTSIAALIKALNIATFAAKRILPIVGGFVYNDTAISKITIIDENGRAWDPSNLAQKPHGLFIE